MSRKPYLDPRRVRDEVAAVAARLIAEDGHDYATAKRKAARQILGDTRIAGEWLPDNEQIEEAIREYQALFQSDSQPRTLQALRGVALEWMHRLAEFQPYLVGAVLNGTANQHSDVHLQVFCDNAKDVAIFLLNAGIQYEVSETRHFNGRGQVETLSFAWHDPVVPERIWIHLALYDTDDLRGAVRADGRGRPMRANEAALHALLASEPVSGAPHDGPSEGAAR
ncbi:UDP-N-acetylmuramate--alanine ligase [Pararobbsia silviterrae]|uniref:UDP-N-acetylmuramate--alanine ligase n=1 Tax=Pararobbsia silviterrae TaxID=1792498 RepID=A0A494XIU3_9BURK|nr:UDP-N-acetylmuramate--alanine ligase [Pararobbsia silviterrae]RKP48556.1 UDP-N-acetylmuramate--alanine ligase [Pararobbsia silviterrae]